MIGMANMGLVFGKNKDRADGLQVWCRSCKKQDMTDRRWKQAKGIQPKEDPEEIVPERRTREIPVGIPPPYGWLTWKEYFIGIGDYYLD